MQEPNRLPDRDGSPRTAALQFDLLAIFQALAAISVYLASHRLLGPERALAVLIFVGVILTGSLSERGYVDLVLFCTPLVIWTLFFVLALPVGRHIEGEAGLLYAGGFVMLGMVWLIITSIVAVVRLLLRRDRMPLRLAIVALNCSWLVPLGIWAYLVCTATV